MFRCAAHRQPRSSHHSLGARAARALVCISIPGRGGACAVMAGSPLPLYHGAVAWLAEDETQETIRAGGCSSRGVVFRASIPSHHRSWDKLDFELNQP